MTSGSSSDPGTRALIRLHPSLFDEAAQLLARAYWQDPLMRYVAWTDDLRERAVPHLMRMSVRTGLEVGEVWRLEGELDCLAIWLPPNAEMPDDRAMGPWGLDAFAALAGDTGMERLHSASALSWKELESNVGRAPVWHLINTAVEPAHQGRGLGQLLLRPTMQRADEAKQACYLETYSNRNVRFYERFGFALESEVALAEGGPTLRSMLRLAGSRHRMDEDLNAAK